MSSDRTGERGRMALEAFIEAFAEHPLGNPLATEARRLFAEGAARARVVARTEHQAEVDRAFAAAEAMLRRGSTANALRKGELYF